MGYEAKKTEHAGAKHGNGAYWGYKWEAKKESNRIRRENWSARSAPPELMLSHEESRDRPGAGVSR